MKTLRLLLVPALFALLLLPLRAYEGWLTDLDAGRAQAKAEGKQLVVEFTGSTWCNPCKRLHAEVLTSEEFARWSRDKVLVKLDYPRSRERTPEKIAADPALAQLMRLKEQFGVQGFPTTVLLNQDGRELTRAVGYEAGTGPAAFLRRLQLE